MRRLGAGRVGLVALAWLLAAPAIGAEAGWETAGWHLLRPGETLAEVAARYLGRGGSAEELRVRNPRLAKVTPGARVLVELRAGLPADGAILSRVGGRVESKPAPVPWLPGRRFDLLARGDGLRTFAAASAEVAFADSTRLVLTEESLVFLRGGGGAAKDGKPMPATAAGSGGRIEIVHGQADLERAATRKATDAVEIVLGPALARSRGDATGALQTRVRRDRDGATQLMVYRGTTEVQAAGSRVVLAAGTGAVVPPRGRPSPPQPLLAAPALLEPAAGASTNAAALRFRWGAVAGAAAYTFELCRDAQCGELVRRAVGLRETVRAEAVAAGDYYWRVTATSGLGLDGFVATAAPLTVVAPPPAVAAAAPASPVAPSAAVTADDLALGAGDASLVVREEIDVQPSRVSLLAEDPVAPIALGRAEILALPHLGDDVFRALTLLPGATTNDVAAQFHVRGGRRDEVGIRLDGQELYGAFHLVDFDNMLSIVAPAALAAVELQTGGMPVAHGDRASGALDMRTQSPDGGRRWLGIDLFTQQLGGAGTFGGGRGSWLAAGRHGAMELAGKMIVGPEKPRYWDGFGKAEYRLTDRQSLRAHALVARDTLDVDLLEGEEVKQRRTRHGSSTFWLAHQALLGDRAVADTHVSWSRLDSDRRAAELEEEQQIRLDDRRGLDVAELRQEWALQAGPRHAWTGGVGVRRFDAAYDYRSERAYTTPLAQIRSEPRAGRVDFVGDVRGNHASAFVADRMRLLEPLVLELGVRYDRWSWLHESSVSPRANLAWSVGEGSVVRASWGAYSQGQRPYELHPEDGESRFWPVERSTQSLLGFERVAMPGSRWAGAALRVEAYRREVRNPRPRHENLFQPFNTFPELEPDRVRIAPARSPSQGIELFVRGPASRRVGWWATYGFARSADRIDGRSVPRQIDQTHSATFNVQMPLLRKWKLDAAWRYHTGWPTTRLGLLVLPGERPISGPEPDDPGDPSDPEDPEDPEEPGGEEPPVEEPEPPPMLVPELGPLYGERLSSYHRLDLRASREFRLRRGRVTLFVDVQNVYNRRNLGGFDTAFEDEGPEGPRIVKIPELWPGFIPSFGVIWER